MVAVELEGRLEDVSRPGQVSGLEFTEARLESEVAILGRQLGAPLEARLRPSPVLAGVEGDAQVVVGSDAVRVRIDGAAIGLDRGI